MFKANFENKANFLDSGLVTIKYLRDSKSGRIKKDQIAVVSKQNANYLIKHRIAIII